MRFFILLGTAVLMVCLASLVSAETEAGQKSDQKKDKSGKSPSTAKKADSTGAKKSDSKTIPLAKKGNIDLLSKDIKAIPLKPVRPPNSTQHKYYAKQLKTTVDSGNLKLDPGQKSALDKLLGQQPLTPDDRQQLSALLAKGSQAGLTSDDEIALSYLLTDDMARSQPVEALDPALVAKSNPMSIRIHSKATEPIKVFLQIVARTPGEFATVKDQVPDTLKYDVPAGKTYDLLTKGKEKITASVIRIWAVSPSRQWVNNRDQDLALTSDSGSKIYSITFAPPTTGAAPGSAQLSSKLPKR